MPNDPYLIGLPVSRLTDPQEIRIAKAAHTLGRAVHRDALARLFELHPKAVVHVEHKALARPLPWGSRRMGRMNYATPERITLIQIDLDGTMRTVAYGKAKCHPEDNFNRRTGIELAFRRALADARGRTT